MKNIFTIDFQDITSYTIHTDLIEIEIEEKLDNWRLESSNIKEFIECNADIIELESINKDYDVIITEEAGWI
jgi:hypothetical protein